MSAQKSKPAPLETGRGKQMDDNIDDMGRRRDGSVEEQPVDPKSGTVPKPDPTRRDRSGRAS